MEKLGFKILIVLWEGLRMDLTRNVPLIIFQRKKHIVVFFIFERDVLSDPACDSCGFITLARHESKSILKVTFFNKKKLSQLTIMKLTYYLLSVVKTIPITRIKGHLSATLPNYFKYFRQ
ncbi:hypothetical protein HZS_2516 [Henneguya salminicola]|nr:hypothetical protein HZS_2516 [Henneguya salminicola]